MLVSFLHTTILRDLEVFVKTNKSIPIIYEDSRIIIINKQSGIAVQGGEGILHSVDNILQEQLEQKIYLVHRLDKETAGLLLVAKSAKDANEYTQYFSSAGAKLAKKQYLCLCIGVPSQKTGTISANINGKIARTDYIVEKVFSAQIDEEKKDFCLLRCTIFTGRMHQIRIHTKVLGCPILADDKYGDFKQNKLCKKMFGIKKLQLAAVALDVPVNGKMQNFTIDIPCHMQDAINALTSTDLCIHP